MISYRKMDKGRGKNPEFSEKRFSIRALVKTSRKDIQLSVLKFYGR